MDCYVGGETLFPLWICLNIIFDVFLFYSIFLVALRYYCS